MAKINTEVARPCHTALELHNLAYTTFSELTYLAHKPVTDFSFQGQHFRSTQYPKALIEKKQQACGTESMTREGRIIRLTSLDWTLDK
ncbi:MAG: hypothetical protein GY821_04100 [Gammaproteobacteria bacterium]|nr:hypothetical protein [Gammaproteobacteria bacterium]